MQRPGTKFFAVNKVRPRTIQLGWTQNAVIMEADLMLQEKMWYIRAVRQFGWSKLELAAQIAASAHLEISLDLPEEVCYTEENSDPVCPPSETQVGGVWHRPRRKTARQLTHSDYDERDSLTGTDLASIPIIRHIFGDVGGKKRLLLDYTGHPGDVTGPWYTDDFETTWRDVLAGCHELLDECNKQDQ